MDTGVLQSTNRMCRFGRSGRVAVLLGVGFAASCGGGSSNAVTTPAVSTPVLTVVRVSLSVDTIPVGQSAAATVAGLDQNSLAIGIGSPIWSTTAPGVATVTASGIVSAVAPGRTMVIASVNGKQGEMPLTVVQIPISRVLVNPEAARVARGATLQFAATALDFSGRVLPGRIVSWASTDAATATVTSIGVVTAVAPGVATISATSEGATASADITVTSTADLVATVLVSPPVGSLIVGGSLQLAATLKDAAGNTLAGRAVTWAASVIAGANVATVSSAGLVTAVSPGRVIVQAFCEGRYGAATVTVKDDVDRSIVVTFAAPVANGLVGDTLRVVVGVNSLYPVASVIAVVGPRQRPFALIYTRAGALGNAYLWIGSIDITDLQSGPYQVIATATNNRGARGVGSTQFQRDTRVGKGGSGEAPKVK